MNDNQTSPVMPSINVRGTVLVFMQVGIGTKPAAEGVEHSVVKVAYEQVTLLPIEPNEIGVAQLS